MPNSITASGIETATQAELLNQLTAGYEAIYGSDINLESDTPDGQFMNIVIQIQLDLEDWIVQIFNSFDPDNAIGSVLDQRVAINGIQRQGATFTTTNITIVTSQVLTFFGLDQTAQSVYTVADNAGNQWQLITTQTGIAAGTNVFLFQAATPGQALSTPNTITIQVTVMLGVVSVNNPTTYTTLGINEESDVALKIRRQASTGIQSIGYFQSLTSALENINGIVSAKVHENNTSGVDGTGTPGHSIWVIVSGTPNIALSVAYDSVTVYQYGNIVSSGGFNYISVANNNTGNSVSNISFWNLYNPIAQTIYVYRNAGCGMYNDIMDGGASSYTITQIDGTFFNVYWSSVVSENLFIKFTANSLDGINAPNIAGIQSYLVSNFTPGVSVEVNINQLSTLVQQEDPNTMVTSPGFSTSAAGSYTNTLTPSSLNKQFFISSANIIALPIILSAPGGSQTIVSGLVTTTTVNVAHGGNTIQFTPLGGFGIAVSNPYVLTSGTGSVNSSGLYTSSTAGTDVVTFTDSLGNLATATITVT